VDGDVAWAALLGLSTDELNDGFAKRLVAKSLTSCATLKRSPNCSLPDEVDQARLLDLLVAEFGAFIEEGGYDDAS